MSVQKQIAFSACRSSFKTNLALCGVLGISVGWWCLVSERDLVNSLGDERGERDGSIGERRVLEEWDGVTCGSGIGIFIIKGFWTIVFILIITKMFWLMCPPAFFRYLSNSGTLMELQTTPFTEFTGVACSDSVSYNQVQVLSILVLLLACSQDWTYNLQIIVSLEA